MERKFRYGRKGFVIIVTIVLLALSVLSYVAYHYLYTAPVYLSLKVGRPVVTITNGTVLTSPLIVFTNPNGTSTSIVFNVSNTSNTNELIELYRMYAPTKIFEKMGHGVAIIMPTVFEGWIKVYGMNITLDYYLSYVGVVNGSALNITYTLFPPILNELNKTDPALIKYIPYNITIIITEPTKTINAGDPYIVSDYFEWVGKDVFGLTVFTILQYVEYETDCISSIHWAQAWVQNSGVPGYTFYNEISIDGQKWSGQGNLITPQGSFSPPVSQVEVLELTSIYLGININGYGAYGQIASAVTSWTLTPNVLYYYASGTAILGSQSSSGNYTVCS